MYKEFNKLSGNSKIWIYQADRDLNASEAEILENAARKFCAHWKAHGKTLISSCQVLYNRFLILAVDESQSHVSGCSIDDSVSFVREMSDFLMTDFLDRGRIAFIHPQTGKIFSLNIKEAKEKASKGEIKGNYRIFNNFVDNKLALFSDWIIPVKESWLKNHLANEVPL